MTIPREPEVGGAGVRRAALHLSAELPEVSECCVSVESDTDYGFYKIFSYKTVPENSTDLVEIDLSGSRLLLISSILCSKNSLNLSGKDTRGVFGGSIVSSNLPII